MGNEHIWAIKTPHVSWGSYTGLPPFVNSDSCTLLWKIVWTKQYIEMGAREMLKPVGVAAVSDRERNVGSSASQVGVNMEWRIQK